MTLAEMDAGLLDQLLQNKDNFLFDCDGVIWHGSTLIPGAAQALAGLKSKGKRVFYVTNNSTSTRADYATKCQKLGLPAQENEIVCTAHSTALYMADLLKPTSGYRPKVYIIGSPSLAAELDAVGIECIGIGPDTVADDFTQDQWKHIELLEDIKAVVVGFDKHISFLKMTKAASYLRNPHVHFVATNMDQSFPVSSSRITVPGTGCIVATVQLACNRAPTVIGKPEPLMIAYLEKEFSLEVKRSVFVGDRLDTDILLAKRCGMRGILVLSGVSTLEEARLNEKSASQEKAMCVPDYFMEDIGVLDRLLQILA